jgi:hypothetical protein
MFFVRQCRENVGSGSMLSKKDFWGFPEQIDSTGMKRARLKISVSLIRLLRAGGMLRTFSTASARSGHAVPARLRTGTR